jgi:hypothetical protein
MTKHPTLPPTTKQLIDYTGGQVWPPIECAIFKTGKRGRPPSGTVAKIECNGEADLVQVLINSKHVGMTDARIKFKNDRTWWRVSIERVWNKIMVVVPQVGIVLSVDTHTTELA